MSTAANHTTRASHSSSVPAVEETSYLRCPEGRIGYDVAGAGSLVVLVPGMGDLRAGYRFLAPALRAAGYRVACTDLRGHGDSDTTFTLLRRRGNGWRCHRPDRGTRRPRSRGGQLHGRRVRGPRRRAATWPGLRPGAGRAVRPQRQDQRDAAPPAARGHGTAMGGHLLEVLPAQAVRRPAASGFRRVPRPGHREYSPAGTREGVLPAPRAPATTRRRRGWPMSRRPPWS